MFRNANSIARDFTRPVIMSRMTVAGACSAGIGAFVVVNNEGWIVTAAHNLSHLLELSSQEQTYLAHNAKEAAIRADSGLTDMERRQQLKSLGRLSTDGTARAAVWFAGVGTGLTNITRIEAVDLGIAQLTNFDPSSIPRYPKFKAPGPDFLPGTSLCKLGFPFYEANPTWNASTGSFDYPPGQLDACCFPLEGIFTRTQQIVPVDAAGIPISSPVPLEYLETSTPGLKGQSGGPIFDIDGNVWALQTVTTHTPLGFSPIVEINGKKTVEHQFINLGMGPSARTIAAVLTNLGVQFDVVQ